MTVLSGWWLLWAATIVVTHWALPHRFRGLWLALSCLAFVGSHDPQSAMILCGFGSLTYLVAERRARSSASIATGVFLLLALLAYFKISRTAANRDDLLAWTLGVPLGMSYYTFRCIHYLLERYKNTLPPHRFEEFANYLLFFPTILAGPIHRFPDFHRDWLTRRWSWVLGSEAFERLVVGYAKIVVLANFAIGVVLRGYIDGLPRDEVRLRTYLDSLANGFNGYLQFAGYSDIAIGIALLLGFRVIENFNNPLLSPNISEFWKRWHISLSSWCRKYIFDVVVSIFRRPYLAALITMLAIGLWHEISIRYVLWGVWHAAGIMAWQAYQGLKQNQKRPASVLVRHMTHMASVVLTFHFVIFSFILINKPSLDDSIAAYRALLFG